MTSSTPIRHQVPVTDYLRLQARYAHLFRPEESTEVIGRIQAGDGQYEIDYDYCKGCGLCAAECPCGAIQLEPEPS